MTLIFNLKGHGACRWCGSMSSIQWKRMDDICTPTLKFLGLTVRKIWHILCVCVSRPVTLFDVEIGAQCSTCYGVFAANFGDTTTIRFRLMDHWANTVRLIMWPCDLDLRSWRSWRLRPMRVVVLHPYTNVEVRRPCHSDDMVHDVCQH